MVQVKLLTTILKPGKDIALFQARRIGDEISIQSLARQHGFLSWLKENDFHSHIHFAQYDKSGTPENEELMNNFFRNHTNVGAAVVFNTRAYIISDYLKRHWIHDIRLVGFGTNTQNIHYLKEGYISYLIAERPEYQGYMVVKTVLEYLLYNKIIEVNNYTPIDIIIKETVDFYSTTELAFAF